MQHEFNGKVLEILYALIERSVGRYRPSEPKHEIVGDPEWDLYVEALRLNEVPSRD